MRLKDLKNRHEVNEDLVVIRDNTDNSLVLKSEFCTEEFGGLYNGETGEDIDSDYDSLYVRDEINSYSTATLKDALEGKDLYVFYYQGSPYDDDNHTLATLNLDAEITVSDDIDEDDLGEEISAEELRLTEKEFEQLKNSDEFEDALKIWTEDGSYGFILFKSVEELGAESDNDLREDGDSDYDFGKFLIATYLHDGEFVFEFSSGRVMTKCE